MVVTMPMFFTYGRDSWKSKEKSTILLMLRLATLFHTWDLGGLSRACSFPLYVSVIGLIVIRLFLSQ